MDASIPEDFLYVFFKRCFVMAIAGILVFVISSNGVAAAEKSQISRVILLNAETCKHEILFIRDKDSPLRLKTKIQLTQISPTL
jgi:hypothetical protein